MADVPPLSREERLEAWRKRCFLEPLPEDFLRESTSSSSSSAHLQPVSAPVGHHQRRHHHHHHHPHGGYSYPVQFGQGEHFGNIQGYLRITVQQARLAKNYGLTRMDPYCRIRIGHAVLETPAAYNGSKNPRWNQVLHCQIPRGINKLHVEIYNERYLAPDARIAWGEFVFPEELFQGEAVEEWIALSGSQGEEKEGALNVILSYMPAQSQVMYPGRPPVAHPPGMPGQQMYYYGGYPPNYPVPQQQAAPQPRPTQPEPVNEQSLKQLKEMFPQMDEEVFRSVLEANRGNVELSINQLLTMS